MSVPIAYDPNDPLVIAGLIGPEATPAEEPPPSQADPAPSLEESPAPVVEDRFAGMSLEDKLAALYGGEVGDTKGFDQLSAPDQSETTQISMESPLVETTPDESYNEAVAQLWSRYVTISNVLQRQNSPDTGVATNNPSQDNSSQGTVAEMNPNPKPSKA